MNKKSQDSGSAIAITFLFLGLGSLLAVAACGGIGFFAYQRQMQTVRALEVARRSEMVARDQAEQLRSTEQMITQAEAVRQPRKSVDNDLIDGDEAAAAGSLPSEWRVGQDVELRLGDNVLRGRIRDRDAATGSLTIQVQSERREPAGKTPNETSDAGEQVDSGSLDRSGEPTESEEPAKQPAAGEQANDDDGSA